MIAMRSLPAGNDTAGTHAHREGVKWAPVLEGPLESRPASAAAWGAGPPACQAVAWAGRHLPAGTQTCEL